MSSREEELKKYLAKRDRKVNRPQPVERKEDTSVSKNPSKVDPQSFQAYFTLSNAQAKWTYTGFIAAPVCVALGIFLAFQDVYLPTVLKISIGLFVFVNFLFISLVYSRFDRYKKMTSIVSGWNEFLAGRGEGFWNTVDYACLGIRFEQDFKVGELERKALDAFLRSWINKWNNRYKNLGKWTSGTPRDFSHTGADRLEGHANITRGGIPFMLNQLMNELPELLKLLTPDTLKVSISQAGADYYTSIEDTEDREEERRSDERHRQMMNKE